MRAIVTLIMIGDHMMNEDTLEGGDVIMIEVTPGYIRHYGFGKYFWYIWPVNVAIG